MATKKTSRDPDIFGSRVIALHGYPGAGKDTVATWLSEKHGFSRVAFASHLKAAVAVAFSRTAESLEPFKDSELDSLALFHTSDSAYRAFALARGEDLYQPRSFRYHLKLYGTEYMESVDPSRWVRLTLEYLRITPGHVVITDLRCYQDLREYKALRSYCATHNRPMVVWEVYRTSLVAPDSHPSNWLLPSYAIDARINNRWGELETTKLSVDALHAEWKKRYQNR